MSGMRFRAVLVDGPENTPEQPTRTLQTLERHEAAVDKWAESVLAGVNKELWPDARVRVMELREVVVREIRAASGGGNVKPL